MIKVASKTAPALMALCLCVLAGCLLLNGEAIPGSSTGVCDSPSGTEIGDWRGPVSVLAVDGGWALVRMVGWVKAGSVDFESADGLRVIGSPEGGLWVVGCHIREDYFGDATVTGRIVNTTGQDFGSLYLEVIYEGSESEVLDTTLIHVDGLPDGESRAFSQDSLLKASLVAGVEFQM